MASVTVDPAGSAGERLTVESIPVVDLRFLTQSELSALSRCSVHAVDLTRCDDVLIPKIDRSVFNESAGSRKQTYSRFRLARRKPDFSAKPLPLAPGPALDDPERLDNSKIIVLFKRLFSGADSQAADLPPISETPTGPSSSTVDGLETARKKRGRKPKSDDPAFSGESKALVLYDGREEIDKVIVNKNGVAVDLEELAKLDDPFAAEIRRRTEGMDKDEELLGFLTGMEGQWGSRRKRRKVVDANEFGNILPTGWKVLIGMKKKQGRCWLFCRRYISPNGRYFMSCKEVSSYLMSLSGLVDVKAVKQSPPPPPMGHCSEASQLDTQLVSVNAETTHGKDQEAISVAAVMLAPDDTVKQNISVKEGHIGMLEEVGLFRCHKCSSPFYDKNQLLHHLLSCHKRKRRKSGMPIEDDELMKEGHYECQFCNKRFTERVCFFGHVGIHVKNYVKSLEGLPGVNPMQNDHGFVSAGGIPPAPGLEKSESMEVNDDSISFTPDIAASNDLNVDSTYGKLPAKSDPKVPVQTGDHETILSSVDIDQINLVSGTDRTAAEKSTDKADAVPELMDKEATDVENYSDTADLELDSCCEHATVRPSDGKDGTYQTSIEDSVIVEADDVIYSSNVQVQNTNGLLSMVQNSAGLLNDSHEFFSEGDDDRAEQVISKSELLDNDRNKTLNENTEARLCNNIDGEPSYSMEFKHRVVDNERIFGSSNTEIGKKMNVTSEAHQERDPARSSVVPQGKEDTALPESFSGRKSEHCSSSRGDLQGHVLDVDPNVVSLSTSNGVDLGTSDFMKNEIPYDADSFDSNGRGTQSVFVLPGEVISNVVPDNTNTVSDFGVLEPGKDDICVNISFPSSVVVPREDHRYHAENSSSPCRASSRTEPNSAEVVSCANFFNPKSSLDANHEANKEAVKFLSSHLYSPLGTRDIPGASDVFGTCSSVIEEPKQKRELGSILSSLSAGGHAHCLTSQIHDTRDSMNDNSSAACATHLPDLSGSISDINTGVLSSFPQTIPASPSPFSLWNDQPFGVEQGQSRVCDNSREEDRQDRCSETNSLSLTSFQPTCNVGYNLNETYISTVDNFSRLNPLETHRDTDLMIGFRNLNSRSNQDVVNEALWRSNEGNAMQSGLGDSSSSHGQLNGAFQPFDFLSDKGENDIFSVNEKYDNITNFGELRSTTVEPMEFSFLTPQDSNPQLGGPKVMSYGNPGMEQGFESSVWLGKGSSLSNVNARSSFSTVCVWCGSQFQQESIDPDTQAGSIGFLCPTCKARISGPF